MRFGQSTLLDVLTAETEADAGTVRWADGVRFVLDSLAFTATKKTGTGSSQCCISEAGPPAA